jgi:hypothetical protein
MYCPICGNKNKPNDNFCRSCGAKLNINNEPISSENSPSRADNLQDIKREQIMSSSQTENSLKNSKICAILGIIAYILPLISILVGIPLNYAIRTSIRIEFNIFLFYLDPFLFMFYPYVTVLDETLKAAASGFGATFVIFGVVAFVMGIVSRQIRRKAVYYEPESPLKSIGGTFAILAILLAFVSGAIGIILFNSPNSLYYF